MVGIGHLMVYAVGALDLNAVLGNVFGDTQFKKVCVIAALAMAIAQGASCYAVHERVLVADRYAMQTIQFEIGEYLLIVDTALRMA